MIPQDGSSNNVLRWPEDFFFSGFFFFFKCVDSRARTHCFSSLKVTVFLIHPQHLSFSDTKYSILRLAVHFLLRWQKQDLGPRMQ